MYNLIGDIHGNFKTMKALLAKMPKENTLIGMGDLIDRGPRSKEVLDFFANNKIQSLKGNHEHMALEAIKFSPSNPDFDPREKPYYQKFIFLQNGGWETLKSYRPSLPDLKDGDVFPSIGYDPYVMIPLKHQDYLKSLPLKIVLKDIGFLLTHAPVHPMLLLKKVGVEKITEDLGTGWAFSHYNHKSDISLIWNRKKPKPIEGFVQIFGHNGLKKGKGPLWLTNRHPEGIYAMKQPENEKLFALCIDTWKAGFLTGISIPDMTIYTQELID